MSPKNTSKPTSPLTWHTVSSWAITTECGRFKISKMLVNAEAGYMLFQHIEGQRYRLIDKFPDAASAKEKVEGLING